MNPVIEAAIISGGALILSGGWTAVVAITTTRHGSRTNQRTIDAAEANTASVLDAAREDRVWDKRAEAYVDALRFLQHQQAVREDSTRMFRYDDATEKYIQERLASFNPPNVRDFEMPLFAFASQPVLDALQASVEANGQVEKAYQNWKWLEDEARKNRPDAPGSADVIAAHHAIQSALIEADNKDDALLAAIRADLHARPSKAIALPPDDPLAS